MKKFITKILAKDHHRNGVSGTPFNIALFKDTIGDTLVGIVFDDNPGCCAVLNVELLSKGVIEFGINSYRGDVFQVELAESFKV